MVQILDNTLSFGTPTIGMEEPDRALNFICSCASSNGVAMIDIGKIKGKADNKAILWLMERTKNNRKANLTVTADLELFKNKKFPYSKDIGVFAIRLFFNKQDIEFTLEAANQLDQYGYKVFLCPRNMAAFSDIEIAEFVQKISQSGIAAFYICENQGDFHDEDLLRQLLIIDHSLDQRIAVGLHLGISFSQGFKMVEDACQLVSSRKIIIDSTMLGIGVEQDYLNTELLLENMGISYQENPIMDAMEIMWPFMEQKIPWGYSPLAFLSAKVRCDMEYLQYYFDKGIRLNEMRSIVQMMGDDSRRCEFDKSYADAILKVYKLNK